ncbi:adenylyl-sulfate kinase [Sinomicrobium weinanense]|uniref:Adenylyl-sulfate kinase n=1 Tax=Sinomicrobium weinanense TaxID=2842200 RepID=A0A926JPV4_9FLAO|nr:adenylyl-sulfate kinase [Sinomicrobium weinanense]MBC9795051.1 adenylyl-sulfate kinase [Sinomicrobium weinanense]MBU3123820.1 adenylyl-sulfate kinase [Sinomicrobium weinanense]
MEKNVVKQHYKVSKRERNLSNNHNSFLIWFTGLSGSGKSTIANAVEQRLHDEGIKTYVLDGDNIRRGINSDLSFSPEDRSENIRRIAEIANLMVDAGLVVLAAFVSPYKKDREFIANTVKPSNFVEIYVSTSLEECERRDVKGLYKKAREGKIGNMTGVSAPYEAPENPDVEVKTEEESIPESVEKILNAIKTKLES